MNSEKTERIEYITLDEIKVNEDIRLSYPIKRERLEFFNHYYYPMPVIIVNLSNEIIFGFDHCYGLLKQFSNKKQKIKVLKIDIKPKEALFVNFNLSNQIYGLNTYEKLIFIKRALRYSNVREIYQKTIELKINLNEELIENLNTLLSQEYKEILIKDQIDLLTAVNIGRYKPDNRKTIIELFNKYHFSRSNQQKILEMLEELIFKYKCSVKKLLNDMGILKGHGKRENSSEVFERIFKYRFPKYTKKKIEFLKKLSKHSIPSNISITTSPLFEKKSIELQIKLKDVNHLEMILEKIKDS